MSADKTKRRNSVLGIDWRGARAHALMKMATQNAIAKTSLHAAASENTILDIHDASLNAEIKARRAKLSGSDDETVPHGVLGHRLLGNELEQVVGAARLHARARQAVAAKRLAADHGAGDAAVDVEVPDRGARADAAHD